MDLSYGSEFEAYRKGVGGWLGDHWPLKGEQAELPTLEQHALFRTLATEQCNQHNDDEDLNTVRSSLDSALTDLRSIARGLRLPEIQDLSPTDTARRVLKDFERATGRRGSWREIDAHYRNRVVEWWREHPLDGAVLFARKAYWFLTSRHYDNVTGFTLEQEYGLHDASAWVPVETPWIMGAALLGALLAVLSHDSPEAARKLVRWSFWIGLSLSKSK